MAFITFEGIDRCGKGTQIRLLADWLDARAIKHAIAREPGGTPIGELLRHLLKRPRETFAAINEAFAKHEDFAPLTMEVERDPFTEVLLFMTARREFVARVITPALGRGEVVIADRFGDSTRAYQGGGLFEHDEAMVALIHRINRAVAAKAWPQLTFIIDIDYATSIARAKGRSLDAIESRGKAFYERVSEEYRRIAQQERDRVVIVDGAREPEKVFEQIVPHVERLLSANT